MRHVSALIEATIEANAMDVTVCADRSALHFYTRSGIVRVIVPLRVLLATARADKDANGHPFPLAAPGDVAPLPSGAGRRTLPAARVAAYTAARRDFEGGMTKDTAAVRHGLTPAAFRTWLQKTRRREAADVDRTRGQFKRGKAA